MSEENKKFIKFLEENRNSPDKVFNLAKTKWQKMVAVEFFLNREEHKLMKQKLEIIEKLVFAVLGVTLISVIGFFVGQFLGLV